MPTPGNTYQAFEYHQKFRKRGTGVRAVPVAPYAPREVGTLLGYSAATIRAMVADDPSVHRKVGPGGKVTMKIPEETVLRLRARLVRNTLQPKVAPRVPRRVVSLRDLHTRVA